VLLRSALTTDLSISLPEAQGVVTTLMDMVDGSLKRGAGFGPCSFNGAEIL
jgi:hypothetical protein